MVLKVVLMTFVCGMLKTALQNFNCKWVTALIKLVIIVNFSVTTRNAG